MNKSEQTAIHVGPFGLGVNNVDDPASSVFQIPENKADKPLSLTKALNVDLDRKGWVKRRKGRTHVCSLDNGHSLASVDERLFVVSGGNLCEVDSAGLLTIVATDVGDSLLSYCAVGGSIFYASPHCTGLVGGVWGLMMPSPPLLTPSSGSLLPGTYLVAITVESLQGVESGARASSTITLSNPVSNGINISLTGLDPNAEFINVYCSEPNGRELYWVNRLPVTATASISSLQQSTDSLRTFNFYPPPKGQLIAVYRGHMLVAKSNTIYWSQPLAYHHFKVQTDFQLFPDRIVLLLALDHGFYVATPKETFWVSGEEPDLWTPVLVDSSSVIEGSSIKLPSQKLPTLSESLTIKGEIAVWATSDGFVAGLPDGVIRHLTDGRVAMDAFKQGSLLFREEDNLRQLLLSLQSKQETNALGMTDRATCRVIRANENVGEP